MRHHRSLAPAFALALVLVLCGTGAVLAGTDREAARNAAPDQTLVMVASAWVDAANNAASADLVPERDDFDDDYKDEAAGPAIADPFERWNRFWFSFNDFLYFNALKPLAQGYGYILPEQLRTGIRNIFKNLLFPVRFLNCLLQGKLNQAAMEFSRFQVNTLGGFGGFGDLSNRHPDLIIKDEEDFGQTLGVWGFGDGPYLVWPVLGSSSVRDSVGLLGDSLADPVSYITPWYDSLGIKAYRGFNDTSLRIGDYEALVNAAVDPYTAMRNAYSQYRTKKVAK
ncbi:MAG: VacJ family lipoprotein [Desulfovibrionaceae bacterium]|jgi:phospholipid-binding lipoprotein MlaA|nr:VacJ family lipoprotein [Desulfovibrionaceae bacterium]